MADTFVKVFAEADRSRIILSRAKVAYAKNSVGRGCHVRAAGRDGPNGPADSRRCFARQGADGVERLLRLPSHRQPGIAPGAGSFRHWQPAYARSSAAGT